MPQSRRKKKKKKIHEMDCCRGPRPEFNEGYCGSPFSAALHLRGAKKKKASVFASSASHAYGFFCPFLRKFYHHAKVNMVSISVPCAR